MSPRIEVDGSFLWDKGVLVPIINHLAMVNLDPDAVIVEGENAVGL